MITLGSLELRDGLIWEEEFQYTGIVQEIRPTLGGTTRVYSGSVSGPMPITLSSLDDQGWQTIQSVQELQTMAKSSGQYSLVLGSKNLLVEFRHYDPPVIEVGQLIPRTDPLSDDYCRVKIRLVCYSPT